jgi:hypothetical protein
MDWSYCFFLDVVAKADATLSLIGVVGVDLFFCTECISSMVCAHTDAELSSWHTPFSCFFCLFVLIHASLFGVAISPTM